MSKFILPSGKRVEFHEPNWGEILHAIDAQARGAEAFANAKCAAVVSSPTLDEIAKLSPTDGLALLKEVNRRYLGAFKEDLPLDNGSPPPPTDSSPETSTL